MAPVCAIGTTKAIVAVIVAIAIRQRCRGCLGIAPVGGGPSEADVLPADGGRQVVDHRGRVGYRDRDGVGRKRHLAVGVDAAHEIDGAAVGRGMIEGGRCGNADFVVVAIHLVARHTAHRTPVERHVAPSVGVGQVERDGGVRRGLGVEHGGLVVVVDAVAARADAARAGVQVGDHIVLVAIATPSPIEMEIVVVAIAVANEGMATATARTGV